MGAGDIDPASPPPIPRGWDAAPPDFVGLGVQKAGTTWWYDTVAAHRRVHDHADRPKELHFFDRFWGQPFGEHDIGTYHQWFARPPGNIAGEWTPRYLHDWWVPALVAASAPRARFLVMLRDPVERYLSGVAHELRSRGRRDPAIPGDALRRSCYGSQLVRLLGIVPREQVLVQQFERCVREPERERSRAWEHLGLDQDPDARLPGPLNVTEQPPPSVPTAVMESVERELGEDLQLLASMSLGLDLELWPSARRVLRGRPVASR